MSSGSSVAEVVDLGRTGNTSSVTPAEVSDLGYRKRGH